MSSQPVARENAEPHMMVSIDKALAEVDSILVENQIVPSSEAKFSSETSKIIEKRKGQEVFSEKENSGGEINMRFSSVIRRQNANAEKGREDREQKLPLISSEDDEDEIQSTTSRVSARSQKVTIRLKGMGSKFDQVTNPICQSNSSLPISEIQKPECARRTKSAPTIRSTSRDRGGRRTPLGATSRPRGLSLEREISRMIIQQSATYSQNFVTEDETPTTSTEEILNDLLTSIPTKETCDGDVKDYQMENRIDLSESPSQYPNDCTYSSGLRELSSLLDIDTDDEESYLYFADEITQLKAGGQSSNHAFLSSKGSLLESSSSEESTSSKESISDSLKYSGLEIPNISTTHNNASLDKPVAMEDNNTEVISANEVDVSRPSLNTEYKTFSESDDASSSEQRITPILVSSTAIDEAISRSNLKPQHLEQIQEDERFEASATPPPPAPPVPSTPKETTFSTMESSNITKTNSDFDSHFTLDDEWTSFGETSFFGKTFSPEKSSRKQAAEPHSPSSVVAL